MARIVALMAVTVLAAAPAAALAAAPADPTQSPFQQAPAPTQDPVGQTPVPTPTQQQQTQVQADDGSIGGWEALLVGVGIVALIGGIWVVIARDAKRATAGRMPPADAGLGASATRASRRSRRLSAAERKRRKRGRATK